jgi:hypothetical protein
MEEGRVEGVGGAWRKVGIDALGLGLIDGATAGLFGYHRILFHVWPSEYAPSFVCTYVRNAGMEGVRAWRRHSWI